MTSVEMRSNSLFKRNEFNVDGRWQMPVIKRQEIELENVQLIAYSDIRLNDNIKNRNIQI